MSSVFEQAAARTLALAQERMFFRSISYTALGVAAATITAHVVINAQSRDDAEFGAEDIATASVTAKATDVSNPQVGDTFTADGVVWAVEGFTPLPSGHVLLQCSRRDQAERAGDGYRGV